MRRAHTCTLLRCLVALTLVGLASVALADAPPRMTAEQEAELSAIRAAIDSAGAHWTAAPNSISVLPREEFRRMLGGGWPPEVKAIFDTLRPSREDLERTYPSYWDWRDMEGVTPVKNQGGCGSCWDFAATGALEGNLRVNEGVIYDLSEQQGLDCNDGGSSCDGGWQGDAYAVYTDPGAVSEECMPYLGTESSCAQKLCEKVAIMDGYQWVAGNVNSYKAALLEGPISTCYTVYEDFDEYTGGCYQHVWGSATAGHCIVIVGWDDSMCGGDGAWICKNSWGGGWGESGYFYIKYGNSGIGYGAERPLNAHIPRERFVPDEFATIQSAIDNSSRGDVIRVAGGTYYENLVVDDYRKVYGGYDPTFLVRDLDEYPTVIDAQGVGHGVTISGESNVVFDGFEIRNATGATNYGIYLNASDAIVRNCEVHDSYRGINLSGAASDAEVLIERCVVRDNEDHGICLFEESYENVTVLLTASHSNGGDGVYSNSSLAAFQYCTLAANGGDGLDVRWTDGNEVTSSIICSNEGYGINCTVATPANAYNDVWGNALGDYRNCSAGAGSISDDPIFCDAPGGDVRVHATSPTLGEAQQGDDMGALGIGCPAGPSNLAVAQSGASLELSWDPPAVARADVDYYAVYRETTLYRSEPVAYVDAPAQSFTDVTIPPCVMYNYWVSAVGVDSLESAVSNRTYSELCYAGPTGLSAEFYPAGNELVWSDGSGPIHRYEIVRSTSVDPPDSVGSVYPPSTSYVDAATSSCPRDNYFYQIVPVYDTGWRGAPTDSAGVDPTPSAPAGLAAERVGSNVVLTWSPSCESDFKRYRVYRDTMPLIPPPGNTLWIGQTGDTTYVDEGLDQDLSYFYRLIAIDASYEWSGFSEMAYVADPVSRTVPDEYATIQAAIDASSPPDTVLVQPGTYGENLVLKDGVIVTSTGGREVTTVTSATGPLLSASAVCDLTRVIGFTIDGQGTADSGIEAWASYLSVEACEIRNCNKGAAAKFGGEPAFSGNTFAANQYGISVADSAAPLLVGNTFDGNSVAAIKSSGTPGPLVGSSLAGANDFMSGAYFKVFNSGPDVLDAKYNYWGDPCPDPSRFYGLVDYTPWTDETHSEILTECTGIPGHWQSGARVYHNYPNPFNPETTIRYTVPEPGAAVDVSVYDIAGRRVRTLYAGEQPAGEHAAVWLGLDDAGREVASGVYFYRVRIGAYSVERKMLLLK